MTADPYTVPAEGGTWHWIPAGPAPQAAESVQPRDPGHNGWNISQDIGLSPQQRQAREAEVAAIVAKAEADPSTLTGDEVNRLPKEVFDRYADAGQLRHAGVGPRKHSRRRGW